MMSEVEGVIAGVKVKIKEAVTHHNQRPGAGQIAAFTKDMNAIADVSRTKLQNLVARGANVTAARASIDSLVSSEIARAVKAGKVDPAATTRVADKTTAI